mgnify:CR=1 FL=1
MITCLFLDMTEKDGVIKAVLNSLHFVEKKRLQKLINNLKSVEDAWIEEGEKSTMPVFEEEVYERLDIKIIVP